MSEIENKISRAKAKLLLEYPYFGTIASKLELVVNDDIQAFKSNGIKLEYNSDFFKEIELSEMEFVFANGAMHASLAHDMRKNGRSGWLWQMATDFAINDMLTQNGMDRPQKAQYRKIFEGMYAEEIYAELKADMLRDDEELEYEADDIDDIKNSDAKKDQNTKNSNDTQKIEQDDGLKEQLFEEFTKGVLESEFKKDELPESIERFFDLKERGKIDWRDELRSAIDIFHKDDYTLIPPNKKFLHLGFYIPACTSARFQLVIAIDSSASIDEKLLSEFLSEVNFLMYSVENYEIELIVCDEKIHSRQTFYTGDTLSCQVIGEGATDFRPVFELIKSELKDTRLLLYFTDLEGVFPNEVPTYDVKWVSPKEADAPFGELIVLESS